MNINIICVGGVKEKYFSDAINEYMKRLSKFHNVSIVEVAEYKTSKNPSISEIQKVKVEESNALNKHLKGYVVLLDIKGKSLTSEELSEKIQSIMLNNSTISFVIGGSFGVCDEFKKEANYLLSFSKFTFPHQLMRVILMEQLYRATTIANNITYHK